MSDDDAKKIPMGDHISDLPGRDKDALVAEKIMGWKRQAHGGRWYLVSPARIMPGRESPAGPNDKPAPGAFGAVPCYYTDMAEAVKILQYFQKMGAESAPFAVFAQKLAGMKPTPPEVVAELGWPVNLVYSLLANLTPARIVDAGLETIELFPRK